MFSHVLSMKIGSSTKKNIQHIIFHGSFTGQNKTKPGIEPGAEISGPPCSAASTELPHGRVAAHRASFLSDFSHERPILDNEEELPSGNLLQFAMKKTNKFLRTVNHLFRLGPSIPWLALLEITRWYDINGHSECDTWANLG